MGVENYIVGGMTALSIGAKLEDDRRKSSAILEQLGRETDAFVYKANMTQEQIEAVDRELSLALTDIQIQGLKDEATLKAYSASSGLSGVITADMVSSASASARANSDKVVGQARSKESQLYSKLIADKISFKNKVETLSSLQQTQEQSVLGSITAGLQGFNQGLSFLTPNQKENFLGG